jgi:branched-subunit amino acid ABC-type transport system permease component
MRVEPSPSSASRSSARALTKLTPYSGLQTVLVFTVLIGVLLIKPTGLLGKAGIEKV